MWKVGKKYKCIRTDSFKNFTVGKDYELSKISPFALAYQSPLYWFQDDNDKSKFIVSSLVDQMFQDIKEIRKEKLNKINHK